MKRSLQLLLMVCLFLLGTQVSYAAGLLEGTGVSDEHIYDSDAILTVQTLAIADPVYSGPKSTGEPDVEDLPDIIMDGTLADKKNVLRYVSYREVCQGIKVSTHIDVLRLERKKAFAAYKAAIKNYADAYVVVTVSNGTTANDGTRLNVFFDVYNAADHSVMYTYRKLAPKSAERDTLLYTEISKDFVKAFIDVQKRVAEEKEREEKAILKLEKDEAKKAAKEAEKAEKAAEKAEKTQQAEQTEAAEQAETAEATEQAA